MSEWRYTAWRLLGDGTATALDLDVPLADVEIQDVLSGVNGLSGTIAPEYTRLKDSDGMPILDERFCTAIFAESQGHIYGGGILTHSGFDKGKWSLECSGYLGYWQDMPYTGAGQFFIKTDTLDIVRHIIDHVQDQSGGDLALIADSLKSGVKVGEDLESEEYDPEGGPGGLTLETQAYKLAWYQDHDLASNIDGLAQDTPFDYHERHVWDGDEIKHHLDFGVPNIGRRRNDLRFVVGENIFAVPGTERDGLEYASEVYVLGAGEGARMRRGHSFTPRVGLRRVAVVSDSSIRRTYRANNIARAELKRRQNLENITSVVVRQHKHAEIGSVSVGDEIYVEGETGWIEIGSWHRVVSRTIRPDAPGAMELEIVRTDRLAA